MNNCGTCRQSLTGPTCVWYTTNAFDHLGKAHHDPKAQTEGRCEEGVAVLNTEVFLPWEEPDKDVDIDDASTEDAGC